jgi:hypothetical protein
MIAFSFTFYVLTVWFRDGSDHEPPCQNHFAGNGETLPKEVFLCHLDSDYALDEVRNTRSFGRVRQRPDFWRRLKFYARFSELKIRSGDKQVSCHTVSFQGL